MDTVEAQDSSAVLVTYTIGKPLDTFIHRQSLKALGMTFNGETKNWETFDEETWQEAMFVVTGKRPDGKTGGVAGGNTGRDGEEAVQETQPERAEQGNPDNNEETGRDVDDDLKDRELIAVGRAAAQLTGQRFGDYARGPLNTKEGKVARIKEMVPSEATRKGLVAQVLGSGSGNGQSQAEQAQGQGQSAQSQGAGSQGDSQGNAEREKKRQQAAQQAQQVFGPAGVNAIQAIAESELDEDRVREIAREEAGKLDTALLEKIKSTGVGTDEKGETQDSIIESLAGVLGEAATAAAETAAKEAVANLPQRALEITVQIGDLPPMEATGMHPLATKVAALLHAGLNVALVGPPGAGKSHMAADVAKLLGREYGGSISLSAGVTESALIGRVLPVLNGTTGGMWLTTPFVEAYEKGKLYLLDEMDAADSNVLLVCNQALSNGGFYIEARLVSGLDPFVAKSPLFCGLAAMNTTGSGATSQFSGRGALDAATTDRWYLIGVDYDGSYEARLTGRAEPAGYAPWQPGPVLTNLEAASWGSWVEAVRDRLKQVKSKRFFSTRALQKALGARRVGVPAKEVVQDLFFGWKPDELASLGALATFDPQGV